jgi:hypothetical protein
MAARVAMARVGAGTAVAAGMVVEVGTEAGVGTAVAGVAT